jgi:hypothetical protein
MAPPGWETVGVAPALVPPDQPMFVVPLRLARGTDLWELINQAGERSSCQSDEPASLTQATPSASAATKWFAQCLVPPIAARSRVFPSCGDG